MAAFQESVYIIDDDLSFGRSLKRLLNARGLEAVHFQSAGAFLASVPFDRKGGVAIIDISMPECDGFALMDKMNSKGYGIPVILVTGHAQINTHKIAMERGALGFLEKPFKEELLLELIEPLLK